jgi:sugar phosphate isomerase/epimerase
MKLHGHTIGVCSWSLRVAGAEELVRQVTKLGLGDVQIDLGSLLELDDLGRQREMKVLLDSGLAFTGGMIGFAGEDYTTIDDIRRTGGFVPDARWPERKRRLQEAVQIARELPIRSITTHVGFIPSPDDPRYRAVAQRVSEAAGMFASADLRLLMETGQEPASELAAFLQVIDASSLGRVGINFDPANMILYGAGDPIEAVGILGKWICHVHVKDAIASAQPGKEWGTEVAFGTGQVGAGRFLGALKTAGYRGALAIEREAGASRAADVAAAIAALASASF